MPHIPNRLKSLTQRMLFAAERFGQHELANHAAAGAYAFLLSATPALLLVLGLASTLLNRSPRLVTDIATALEGITGPLDTGRAARDFFSRPLGPLAIAVGAANLAWAARLFVVTIQRGIRVIWAATARNAPVRENLLGFAIELLALLAVVALLIASRAMSLLAAALEPLAGHSLASALLALSDLAPPLTLLAFVYWSYRLVPAVKPRRRVALGSATLCVLSFALVSWGFKLFVNSARYDLLYGIFGNLIVLLVNVYAFFSLYFYFAELAYVEEHFDALLFGRFYKVAKSGSVPALERSLFMEPKRLLRSYGRSFGPGETIFAIGDTGRSAYFVYRGRVGVYLPADTDGEMPQERRIAYIETGEVFGEMAHILDEPRTATVRAFEESVVLELPPTVFDLYLRADSDATRRLVDILSARLKEANARRGGDRG